jgi:hypothetical protein
MSKSKSNRSIKAERRALALKKARQKKVLIICVCVLVVAGIVTLAVLSANRQRKAETYSDGFQMVRLFDDGTFTAHLMHNLVKSGTYTRSVADGRTIITFTRGGNQEIGWIDGDSLRVPVEWEDGCGHSVTFRRTS